MGKAARTRRKIQRDAQKRARRNANRAKYQAMAGTESNKKRKAGSDRARATLRVNRRKTHTKRVDVIEQVHHVGERDSGYGLESVYRLHKVQRTWKQTHNTVSLKQYLKLVA